MPLTLSHPAAVLPLRRLGLPMTAMVVGSMVPDIPLFLRWPSGYALTHSLRGVFVVDVAVTLVVLWIWFALARDALVDLAPRVIRSRVPRRQRLAPRQWLRAPVAAVVGALTHVVWDVFTHANRWGVDQITWLQTDHAGLTGYRWAQYLSGVLGLLVVVGAVLSHVRSLPTIGDERPAPALSPVVLYAVLLLAVLTGAVSAARLADAGFHAMAYRGVVNSLLALALGAVLGTAAWHLAVQRSRTSSPDHVPARPPAQGRERQPAPPRPSRSVPVARLVSTPGP